MIPEGVEAVWRSIPFLLVGTFPDGQIGGLALTVILSVTVGAASLTFGTMLGTAAALSPLPLRVPARTMIIFLRGTPALAFLFWIYFLLPRLVGVDLSPLLSAGLALTLYHGAYIGEDIRGGLRAVPREQWEASRCLGLRTTATLLLIILPQAVRAVTPSLVGRMINLVIYTSVVSILGVLEFTRAAVLINNRELLYPQYIFAFVGIVYFLICYGIATCGRRLELRWNVATELNRGTGRRKRQGDFSKRAA